MPNKRPYLKLEQMKLFINALFYQDSKYRPQSSLLGDSSGNIKISNGFFGQNLQKRSKTEKVNITKEFFIFEIV